MDLTGLIFIAIGLFTLSAAAFNWDWFMNARNARFFVGILGRTGARIFYGVLGIIFLIAGILATAGVIEIN